MYGAGYGWYPGGGWYPGRGPGWGWGRGWAYPGFVRPRGWCWRYLFNEKEYLQAEKEALEKYLEIIRGRLEELQRESDQEKKL
ncbi:MAG: DUF5320 domain-containing protein [bacterium]|nr:DUF5320 domain-containing protein [bacterium]